jgi:hypothetical protein
MGLSITTPFPVSAPVASQAAPLKTVARLAVGAAPLLLVGALNLVGRPDLSPMLRLLGSTVCFLGFLPFVFHVLGRKSGLPFMPLYAVLFTGYFGLPIFLDDSFILPVAGISLSDPEVIAAEAVILMGFVTLLAGFYLPTQRLLARVPQMRQGLDEATGVQMGWVLVVFGMAFAQVGPYVAVRFGAFLQIGQQFGILGIALLFYYYLLGLLSTGQKVILLFLIPGWILSEVSGGGVTGPVLRVFLPLVGTYWVARKQFLWKTMLVAALIMVPVAGVKGKFRAVAWRAEANLDVVERSLLYYELIRDGFQTEQNFYYNTFQATVGRMNEITSLVAVQTLTPSVIPYWEGVTYIDLYWSLIPRFLYPDKPGKILGQDFGHRYGLISKFDRVTSFNFPQLVEFYANFGNWGVAIGMLLLGLVQRILYHFFSATDAHPSVHLCGAIILASICSIDSDLSLVYGGLFLNMIGTVLILRVLRARRIHLPMEVFRFRW